MARTLRGRPSLDIELETIVSAVRQHQRAAAAAKALGCSPAYVYKRLNAAQLTLEELLEAPDAASGGHG